MADGSKVPGHAFGDNFVYSIQSTNKNSSAQGNKWTSGNSGISKEVRDQLRILNGLVCQNLDDVGSLKEASKFLEKAEQDLSKEIENTMKLVKLSAETVKFQHEIYQENQGQETEIASGSGFLPICPTAEDLD